MCSGVTRCWGIAWVRLRIDEPSQRTPPTTLSMSMSMRTSQASSKGSQSKRSSRKLQNVGSYKMMTEPANGTAIAEAALTEDFKEWVEGLHPQSEEKNKHLWY